MAGALGASSSRQECGSETAGYAVRRISTCVGDVTVSGNTRADLGDNGRRKPALLTLPDIGLTHITCFGALYLCASAANEGSKDTMLGSMFQTLHVDLPGHYQDADDGRGAEAAASKVQRCSSDIDGGEGGQRGSTWPSGRPYTTDAIVRMVLQVLDAFGVRRALLMGVGFGGQCLAKLAAQHPDRVLALILVNPTSGPPTWTDATYGELRYQSLRFRGTTAGAVDYLLKRYFTTESLLRRHDACRSIAADIERVPHNDLAAYVGACVRRDAIGTSWCRYIDCETLIIVGDGSTAAGESLSVNEGMRAGLATLVLLDGCALLATEERPMDVLSPIELFLNGLKHRGLLSDPNIFADMAPARIP